MCKIWCKGLETLILLHIDNNYFTIILSFCRSSELIVINYSGILKNYLVRWVHFANAWCFVCNYYHLLPTFCHVISFRDKYLVVNFPCFLVIIKFYCLIWIGFLCSSYFFYPVFITWGKSLLLLLLLLLLLVIKDCVSVSNSGWALLIKLYILDVLVSAYFGIPCMF